MPTVVVISSLAHLGVLAAVTLLPPPAYGVEPTPVELAFEVIPPPTPVPEIVPEEPAVEEPVEPEPAIVPRPRPRRARREATPEPAPPPSVLTAPEGAGPADFAMPPGEADGVPGGVPGGTGTGTEGAASEATPEAAPVRTGPSRAELRRRVMSYIRGLSGSLAGQVGYPLAARRERLEGVVILRMRLASDGRVLAVRMSRSSGHAVLDEAALASVSGIASLSAPPDGVPWDEARELPVPIRFRIQ